MLTKGGLLAQILLSCTVDFGSLIDFYSDVTIVSVLFSGAKVLQCQH